MLAALHELQINYNDLNKDNNYLIDVRSPGEYNEFHVPGSVNIPLFTNEERKHIGTLYKQVSPDVAKKQGLTIFSEKLPHFYETWTSLINSNPGKVAVVMCARGGMRSGAFVSMMSSLGLPVRQLSGGVRSVRKNVTAELNELAEMSWQTVVLSGNTGTGKTKWLNMLESKGFPVLDLEGLAKHRGSIFGHVGLEPRSQKQFEYHLVQKLKELKEKGILIMEAESRRIGNIIVPDFLINLKKQGKAIYLEDNIENRVERIFEDYAPLEHHDALFEAYGSIKSRLTAETREEIDYAFSEKDYRKIFRLLLLDYYDLRYNHSEKYYNLHSKISLSGLDEAEAEKMIVQEIEGYVMNQMNVI
ncbi:tRNA 2-selenouridine(34) synthase MnmH [Evansella sp. LMS18]|uniref:tRNA 2-selenouridine(34) synthase MnmH n=1 Tax=Evansella sp. LMS18 TaxID=2924033 RepID=UPI0020D101AB|nr:tRNA 2-selenouridine(34) synthase MnmH [Evansella sp. LMS18]UTR10771.1 tRNA 2-selenouridine(34) synthase MnmH [Evansella sp. LMS18]